MRVCHNASVYVSCSFPFSSHLVYIQSYYVGLFAAFSLATRLAFLQSSLQCIPLRSTVVHIVVKPYILRFVTIMFLGTCCNFLLRLGSLSACVCPNDTGELIVKKNKSTRRIRGSVLRCFNMTVGGIPEYWKLGFTVFLLHRKIIKPSVTTGCTEQMQKLSNQLGGGYREFDC